MRASKGLKYACYQGADSTILALRVQVPKYEAYTCYMTTIHHRETIHNKYSMFR